MKEIRLGIFFKVLIYLMWFGLLFGTYTLEMQQLGGHVIFEPLKNFYVTNRYSTFPGFELILFFIIIYIIIIFKPSVSYGNKTARFMTVIAILFTIVSFFNANNYFENLFDFVSFKVVRTIILAPILMFAIFLLPDNKKAVIVDFIYKSGFIVLFSKISFDLITYISGNAAINIFGKSVTTVGGDILSWYAIFQVMFFIAFLYTRKIKFLLLVLLILTTLILSHQRTATLTALLFDLVVSIVYTLFIQEKLIVKLRFAIIIIILSGSSLYLIQNIPEARSIANRMLAAVEFTGLFESYKQNDYYSDSGHFNQSYLVTQYLLENYSSFWGGGINRRNEDYLYIHGQSEGGVHCNVVSMWQYFGVPGLIFIFFLFFFFVYQFIKNLRRDRGRTFKTFLLTGLSLYFIVRMIAGWFSGDFFFMYSQLYLQYILLLVFFTFKSDNLLWMEDRFNNLMVK